MEFPLSPAEKELRDSTRSGLRSLPSPPIGAFGPDAFPPGLREALRTGGLLETGEGRAVEPRSGLAAVLQLIEVARVSPALAAALAVHNFLFRRYIRESGGGPFSGGWGAWGVSGRGSGDLTALPAGGGWILNGRQSILGAPDFLDRLMVTASAPSPGGAVNVFVVDNRSSGIAIGRASAREAGTDGPIGPEAFFDNVSTPAECLLGCKGSVGDEIRKIVAGADSALAGLCAGIAGSALAHCLEAAFAGGRGRHPVRGRKAGERLAESLIEMETVRFLTCRAALRNGRGEGNDREAREAAQRALDLALASTAMAHERLPSQPGSAPFLADLDSAVAAARLWSDLRGL